MDHMRSSSHAEVLAQSSPSQKSIQDFQQYLHSHGRKIRNNSDSPEEPKKPDHKTIDRITVGEWTAESERVDRLRLDALEKEKKRRRDELRRQKELEEAARRKKEEQDNDVNLKAMKKARENIPWLQIKVK